ncbi:uncharacterized protein C8A04DRAFT_29478 [Dichotomopilus funicola]|uniref:Uncharacterized protein n=1 Tax=Dichotomopilus funicola TaxID=1934379 RepID=A0AAN6V1B9_9PEZI|nr:hypothetical protein C8A04DRAFT_29478 [Dichotomopilus funicola]
MEWTKNQYNKQYESWVPWLEDIYLRYFTKDNKASYTTRENLNKTKVTGISQVDAAQDGINNLIAGQVGQNGLGRPIGDLASREGLNRAERQGKDDQGGYVPSSVGGSAGVKAGEAVQGAGSAVVGGVKGVGSGVGALLGGGKEGDNKE